MSSFDLSSSLLAHGWKPAWHTESSVAELSDTVLALTATPHGERVATDAVQSESSIVDVLVVPRAAEGSPSAKAALIASQLSRVTTASSAAFVRRCVDHWVDGPSSANAWEFYVLSPSRLDVIRGAFDSEEVELRSLDRWLAARSSSSSAAEKGSVHGGLSEDEALGIFVQACFAVHAFHSRGLPHGDVRPAKLIHALGDVTVEVEREGKTIPWLSLDVESTEVQRGGHTVTCGRWSPERWAQSPEQLRVASMPHDVWALGLLLVELLLLKEPFGRDAMAATRAGEPLVMAQRDAICGGVDLIALLPHDVSLATREMLRGMLAPSPQERPTVEELLHQPLIRSVAETLRSRMARSRFGISGKEVTAAGAERLRDSFELSFREVYPSGGVKLPRVELH